MPAEERDFSPGAIAAAVVLGVSIVGAGIAMVVLQALGHGKISVLLLAAVREAELVVVVAIVLLPFFGVLLTSLRAFIANAMAVYSVVAAACAWAIGLFVTWVLWGLKGIIGAVVLAGVGPFPVGYTAALVTGNWESATAIGSGVLFTILGFVIAGRLLSWAPAPPAR